MTNKWKIQIHGNTAMAAIVQPPDQYLRGQGQNIKIHKEHIQTRKRGKNKKQHGKRKENNTENGIKTRPTHRYK